MLLNAPLFILKCSIISGTIVSAQRILGRPRLRFGLVEFSEKMACLAQNRPSDRGDIRHVVKDAQEETAAYGESAILRSAPLLGAYFGV